MTLLRITLPGASLPCRLGTWPPAGPRHRLVLDPSLPFARAVSAVTLALQESPTAWVIASGRAAAPFLAAVGANLALSVAGAMILMPQGWSATRPLDLAPLPFPAGLLPGAPDAAAGRRLARAWGSIVLTLAQDQELLAHPAVEDMIERRNHDLARAAGPRLVRRGVYAAVAGTAGPPG